MPADNDTPRSPVDDEISLYLLDPDTPTGQGARFDALYIDDED